MKQLDWGPRVSGNQLRNLDVSRKCYSAILDSPQAPWFHNCTCCFPVLCQIMTDVVQPMLTSHGVCIGSF